MGEADDARVFACAQCGAVGAQRTGRGRPFVKCAGCRVRPEPKQRRTGRCYDCGVVLSSLKRKRCEPCAGRAAAESWRRRHGRSMTEIAAASPSNRDHTCEGCGSAFRPKRSNRLKFCSRECAFAHRARQATGPKPAAPKPPSARACIQCGAGYETKTGAICCSDECRRRRASLAAVERAKALDARDRHPRPCRECAEVFVPAYGMKRRLFCSEECARRNSKRTARLKGKAQKRTARVEAVNPTRVFERDGWRCHLCGGLTRKAARGTYHPKAPELDHIVPLAKGGEHSYRNTACAHRKCNAAKSDTVMGQPSLLAA